MNDKLLETQREIKELRELEKAYQLHHDGRIDEAYAILWEMCLDKLNKVV